jgi:hypothetical protein
MYAVDINNSVLFQCLANKFHNARQIRKQIRSRGVENVHWKVHKHIGKVTLFESTCYNMRYTKFAKCREVLCRLVVPHNERVSDSTVVHRLEVLFFGIST